MDFLLRFWRSVHDGNPGFEFSGAHCTTHASLSEIQCLPRQGLGGTMTVRIHVDGRVAQGSLTVFGEGIDRYREYAQDHDYAARPLLWSWSKERSRTPCSGKSNERAVRLRIHYLSPL